MKERSLKIRKEDYIDREHYTRMLEAQEKHDNECRYSSLAEYSDCHLNPGQKCIKYLHNQKIENWVDSVESYPALIVRDLFSDRPQTSLKVNIDPDRRIETTTFFDGQSVQTEFPEKCHLLDWAVEYKKAFDC